MWLAWGEGGVYIMNNVKTDGRNAFATCVLAHIANITGQLRLATLGMRLHAGITRMPASFIYGCGSG